MTFDRKPVFRLAALCLSAWAGAFGQPPVLRETSVKAGFLFNFAKFVEWPASRTGPLAFCVIGDDSMASALEAGVAGKSIGPRPLAVRNRVEMAELSSCSVIYIGRAKKSVAAQTAQLVAGKQILTVSEFAELGSQGVVINFYLDDDRVRFEVHRGAVRQAGLNISSRLLTLARIAGQ